MTELRKLLPIEYKIVYIIIWEHPNTSVVQAENFALKKDIQKYKNKLESISDSQKSLFGLTEAINNLI